ADRSSDKNTRRNRRTCPSCPSRAALGLRISDTWCSQIPECPPAAIRLRRSTLRFPEGSPEDPCPAPPRSRLSRSTPPESECPSSAAAKCPSPSTEKLFRAAQILSLVRARTSPKALRP